jgi:hypothetical protein
MTTNCPYYQFAKDSNYFVNNGATTTFWKGNGIASHIDFFNVNAVDYWQRLMNNVLDSMEVDGWKVDESDSRIAQLNPIITAQGNKTTREYSDAYYSAIYNYTIAKRRSKGMLTARPYCKQKNDTAYYNTPISVNTAGWVGDQEHTWDGLNLALKNIFISANAGYAAVGSDIGGYAKEIDYSTYITPNKNLFIRWAQFGSLVPIMENGGQSNKQHQPWLFDSSSDSFTVQTYRYYTKLHHHLVPYLYSYDIDAHLTGTSIMRPIGSDINDWTGNWNYLLGDNLFISAIYENNSSKNITFPSGRWIDYWNEDNVYYGGNTVPLNYALNQYPIFIKSGAIIPMNVDDSETGFGTAASKNYLTLLMYPYGVSTFEYHSDPTNITTIKCEERCCGYVISFNKSTASVIIRLKNQIEPENVILSENVNLSKRNSFADFEGASSGWYHGKLREGENVYTWIKFSNSADTVKIITTSISDIAPNNYESSKLAEGHKYYVDREYTLMSIPDEYIGLSIIKTANNDKDAVGLDFHFNTCCYADIFIAYDHRLIAPSWLKNYYDSTENKIYVSDQYAEYFNIWKKSVSPGPVILGDNHGISESSMYFVFTSSYLDSPFPVELTCKVFLEGCYHSPGMNTDLNTHDLIPLNQPYNGTPWNYSGSESVTSMPSGVVDWVMLELRSNTTSIAAKRAALLKRDGIIVDLDGTSPVGFSGINNGSYYIVVKHRNHLTIMSNSVQSFSFSSTTCYDFTTGNGNQFYPGNGSEAKLLETTPSNVWGMVAGDANRSTVINATDYLFVKSQSGFSGYFNGDCNLSGTVNATDYLVIKPNSGKYSQVP